MQKKSTLEQIRKDLSHGKIQDALIGWFDSYHPISAKEFLECSEDWFPEELLEILIDHRQMYNDAIQEIQTELGIK